MVKTVKGLLLKSHDPYLALLAYRDTPGPLGKTPAELLMGRQLRTTLHPNRLIPKAPNLKEVRKKDAVVRDQQRQNYKRHHGARHLVPLAPGDTFWVKDFRRKGIICRRARRPRSYVVDMESGVQMERNRKMLVKQAPSRVPDSYDESYEFLPNLENPETSDQPNSQALQSFFAANKSQSGFVEQTKRVRESARNSGKDAQLERLIDTSLNPLRPQ
ncbi:hypothetical protein MTO96_033583 [Rhipicephalus appendiculatus]